MRLSIHWNAWGRLAAVSALWLALGCGASTGAVREPVPTAPAAAPEATSPAEAPGLDTVRAGRFDNGKMWTFEYPPLDYFREAYGFSPDSSWFARARLGALRLQGCSASFVSPNGLVLTNHHCARESVTEVSQSGESLLDRGFYAPAVKEERRAESATADQLIAIVDVTDEIYLAQEGKATEEEKEAAREEAEERIQQRLTEQHADQADSLVVEVIELWDGARYSAYVFRRYTDLRLVLAPELQIGFFGGDPDNFTYPRYNLDMSFYRIYDADGNPLQTDHYFKWSETGVSEGDAIFVIGNPGGSSRLQTVAQLEYRRQVQDKVILDFLISRADILQWFYDEYTEEAEARDIRNTIFSLRNEEKRYRGMWEGLFNSLYMARRRDAGRRFREAVQGDPKLSAEYGGLFDRMAEIQQRKLELAPEFSAFVGLGSPDLTSAVLLRGFWANVYLSQRAGGAPEAATEGVKGQLLSVGSQPLPLQRRLLAARLRDFERYFGRDSEIVTRILRGGTAETVAEAIIAGSSLSDSARAEAALSGGTLTMDDPAVQLVGAFIDRFREFNRTFQQLNQQESAVAAGLGRARFEVDGTNIPPDATFSLRIADGVVKGYPYNGTYAPSYTTFYGLYDRYYSHAGGDWGLPERWLPPPASFDLSKPLNFVLTADVIGGNSGSPVVNQNLEVVGLIFDGNIESLPGDYIYDPEYNRSVAVDVRGIIEALDEIYDADRIVLELTTGRLVADEAAADAVSVGAGRR